jgi:Ca-activated chloride channel family protein
MTSAAFTVTFASPDMLWLLAVPALLLLLWLWTAGRRAIDVRRLAGRRVVPVPERLRGGGELFFWLCTILAVASLVVALAQPKAPTRLPRRGGLDIVVLQDASASMRVADGRGIATAGQQGGQTRERWHQSMQLVRALGDALSWNDDRIAMIAFAHVATPQIRLTRDPNTLFFFLDHLAERPPFRLEDDTTWDTNLEQAIAWGLRLVEKDEEIHGRSPNATVFVMLSDGEAWSGEVAKAVARAVDRGIPLHVVGVGTLAGGTLPTVRTVTGELLDSPGTSRLERASLQRIAAAGGGEYFELDRDGGQLIANTIVAASRRLAPSLGVQVVAEDLYWWFVLGACAISALGLLFVRHGTELGILLAGVLLSSVVLRPLLF